MHIWIVNPFDPLPGESFNPRRYAFIANMLSEKGHKVTWWTSNFSHINKQYRCKKAGEKRINANLTIKYLSTPSYNKNVSFARLYNHYIYGKRFEREAMNVGEIPDVILASLPPIESAAAAVQIGKKLTSRVIIDTQDIWPEVFLFPFPRYLKPIAKILLCRLFRKVKSLYKNADALMAVSQTYLERGLRYSEKPKQAIVLPLGIDLSFFDKQVKPTSFPLKKGEKDIWITHVGTLGKTHDLDVILKAVIHFLDKPNVKFIITGGGFGSSLLKKVVVNQKLDNIISTGMLSNSELVFLLKHSDAGLCAFAPDAPQTFVNRIFDYFAAALPVINSIPGELQRLLEENQAGIQYEPGNVGSLIHAIDVILNDEQKRKEMGRNGRRLAEERFDRNKEYLKLDKFFKDLILQHR